MALYCHKTATSPDHKTFSVNSASIKSNLHSHTWSMNSSIDQRFRVQTSSEHIKLKRAVLLINV